jgi:hypothetical protein
VAKTTTAKLADSYPSSFGNTIISTKTVLYENILWPNMLIMKFGWKPGFC